MHVHLISLKNFIEKLTENIRYEVNRKVEYHYNIMGILGLQVAIYRSHLFLH